MRGKSIPVEPQPNGYSQPAENQRETRREERRENERSHIHIVSCLSILPRCSSIGEAGREDILRVCPHFTYCLFWGDPTNAVPRWTNSNPKMERTIKMLGGC